MKLLAPDDTLDDLADNDETSFWRVNRHDALECLSATFRTHVFPPHTHESYVIGAVVGGVNVYRISGALLRAGPGELCFVHPGEVHDAVPEGDGYSYRMIYPKPSLLQNIVEMATGRRANVPTTDRGAGPPASGLTSQCTFARAGGSNRCGESDGRQGGVDYAGSKLWRSRSNHPA